MIAMETMGSFPRTGLG